MAIPRRNGCKKATPDSNPLPKMHLSGSERTRGHSRSWVGAGHPCVPPRICPLGASPRLCPHQTRSVGWAGRQSSSFRSPANKKICNSSREWKWRASEAAVQPLKSVEWVFWLVFFRGNFFKPAWGGIKEEIKLIRDCPFLFLCKITVWETGLSAI